MMNRNKMMKKKKVLAIDVLASFHNSVQPSFVGASIFAATQPRRSIADILARKVSSATLTTRGRVNCCCPEAAGADRRVATATSMEGHSTQVTKWHG